MDERAEISVIDEEGILIRAFTEEVLYFYDGEPEDEESPLTEALGNFYLEKAPQTILCKGFDTPGGLLLWESEWATPIGDDSVVEIGERLFLVDAYGERYMDEFIYENLARGEIPDSWHLITRYE